MIRMNDIVKTYGKGKANEFEALHGVSLEIKDGEMVAVIGTSGAGKSTLLHILACVDSYDSGEYRIDDMLIANVSEKELAHIRNEKVGVVMQDFSLIEDFTALENVMIPLDFTPKKRRKSKKEKRKRALEMLGLVQMEEYADKAVDNLSGGQKQRVAIARALANNPAILLADEPTGALDTKTTEEIVRVFEDLHERGVTIVIVTHDMDVAARCDRMIRISDGNII